MGYSQARFGLHPHQSAPPTLFFGRHSAGIPTGFLGRHPGRLDLEGIGLSPGFLLVDDGLPPILPHRFACGPGVDSLGDQKGVTDSPV